MRRRARNSNGVRVLGGEEGGAGASGGAAVTAPGGGARCEESYAQASEAGATGRVVFTYQAAVSNPNGGSGPNPARLVAFLEDECGRSRTHLISIRPVSRTNGRSAILIDLVRSIFERSRQINTLAKLESQNWEQD